MQIEELVSAQRAFFNTGATKDAAFRRRALAALRQAVTARPVTVDELEATTRLFMEKLNAAARWHLTPRRACSPAIHRLFLTHPAHCTTHWSSSTRFVCFRRQPQAHAVFPGAERAEFYRFFLPVHRGGEFECRFARMPAACDHCS